MTESDSIKNRLLSVDLSKETGVLQARQRAKQIASLMLFDVQEQTRIATAVSEIARNAYEYTRSGRAEFYLVHESRYGLRVVVSDTGKGIPQLENILQGIYTSTSGLGLGLMGARRLMGDFEIKSSPDGTRITMAKWLPRHVTPPQPEEIVRTLATAAPPSPQDTLLQQNQEMLHLLEELRQRENELTQLNQELKETNRGVLVLYAELEDRAQALQHASEMKSRFVSGITHELRTPLNSIVSLTGLLMHRIDGELTPEQEKQVLFIQRSAQNLTEMVNDLLDLSKIEAGKVSVRESDFTVKDVFDALRGMFRPLATNDHVALIFNEAGFDQVKLHTDEGKVAQILRNFVANALKFTEVGSVTISASLPGDGGIRFSVRDTGVGIGSEHKDLVWQEWGQIESDQRPSKKGSGLGLPLARQLASLLGGSTSLDSALGQGSTFCLDLPAAAVVSPAPMFSPSSADSADRAAILIVDDDEVSRYLLRRHLVTLTSARLIEATNTAEARQALLQELPAMIFLDIVMPGQNGIEFAEELRASEPTKAVPIHFVSSKKLNRAEQERIQRLDIPLIEKERGDAEDQRVDLERALLNIGLSDLHRSKGSE